MFSTILFRMVTGIACVVGIVLSQPQFAASASFLRDHPLLKQRRAEATIEELNLAQHSVNVDGEEGPTLQEIRATDGDKLPKIETISPSVALPGSPITIRVVGLKSHYYEPDFWKKNAWVRVGGHSATSMPVGIGLIEAIVPPDIETSGSRQTVFISFSSEIRESPLVFSDFEVLLPMAAKEVREFPTITYVWILAGVSTLLVGTSIFMMRYLPIGWRTSASEQRRLQLVAALENGTVQATEDDSEWETIELPEPPQALVEACNRGDAIGYIGGGFAAEAGVPTWREFVSDLVAKLIASGQLTGRDARLLKDGLTRRDFEFVANVLATINDDRKDYYDRLVSFFGSARAKRATMAALSELPFAGVITHNYDEILETAFLERSPRSLSRSDADACLNSLSREEFFVLKLFGGLGHPMDFVISSEDYSESIRRNGVLKDALARMYYGYTFLFLGASLDSIEMFFESVTLISLDKEDHYALVAIDDEEPSWYLRARSLEKRYGVKILPFSRTNKKDSIQNFLNVLAARSGIKSGVLGWRSNQVRPRRVGSARLQMVELINVGAFDEIEIELDANWNVLLGDNGVGKSTILKAVALALCGASAEKFADRIIRSGQSTAEIVIQFDDGMRHRTTLTRQEHRIDVVSDPLPILEATGMLALGFPALRMLSWRSAPPDNESLGQPRPTPFDVMPIFESSPDPRLNMLKQRFITLDHLRSKEQLESIEGRRYGELQQEFFRLFGQLTESVNIEEWKIDPENRVVQIATPDGYIPIEALSQGTVSLMGWAGVLLQRLYEVAPEGRDPREMSGLVLIDEIDAHMHPTWQRTIVHKLTENFPNIQFIATTHSPLVVGGMSAKQVKRIRRRDDDSIEVIDVAEDSTFGRADQVLASQLFDVDSTLDLKTNKIIEEYQELAGEKDLPDEQVRRLHELEGQLEYRIPVPFTSMADRRAQQLVDSLIERQVSGVSESYSAMLTEQARLLIDEVANEISRNNDKDKI